MKAKLLSLGSRNTNHAALSSLQVRRLEPALRVCKKPKGDL